MKIFVSKTISFIKVLTILKVYNYQILETREYETYNMLEIKNSIPFLEMNEMFRDCPYVFTFYKDTVVIHRISD